MNHESRRSRFGWISFLMVAALGAVLLPMAPRTGPVALQADDGGQATTGSTKDRTADATDTTQPRIIETVPKVAATDVDPGLREIRVTFDRDMATGMSWTSGSHFPPATPGRWIDRRTCVLPVTLAKGTYYRVGINSSRYRNFKANDSTPVPAAAIYFVTAGATDEVNERVRVPEIATLTPKQDATGVDPAITELRVTFDVRMGEGMSWTWSGAGERFPKPPAGKQATWSADGLTCSLPVALDPGREYELGLNNRDHVNFQSEWGVPLAPVVYKFSTRAAGK
jgi:hypothetical protein